MIEIAKEYLRKGVSVIPVKADGSKSPSVSGWRRYASIFPDESDLEKWFSGPKLIGIGAVPGPASGNMVVLDFEHHKGQSAYTEWLDRLPEHLRDLALTWPTVATPSGGRHIWIRLPEPQPGGKLARYRDSGKTKIEIRGEGHQVLAPGCPAECHNSKKEYAWLIYSDIPVLDLETWGAVLAVASQCNEYTPPEQVRDFAPSGEPAGDDSPGNDFNLRGSWADTGLFDAGWKWFCRAGDDAGYLTRPGKSKGVSASIGMVSSRERGYPYFYNWSTSVPEFATETPYSKFAVYATLRHGNNYSEAAKELYRIGYGQRWKPDAIDVDGDYIDISGILGGSKPDTITPEALTRWFKWASELSARTDDAKWLWEGYIPRQAIVLMSALWKAGKTTLLSHLIKAFDGSKIDFLGQQIFPCRVLLITEEDEDIWAERVDQLGIGDHLGVKSRPFRHKPTLHDWRAFIRQLCDNVQEYQFDLVIFDTLSKIWPVKNENDASEVEEALTELWQISKVGAATMLQHHIRKSGGGQYTSSRGSGGISAFPDLLIDFKRFSDDLSDRRRKLEAIGRYSGIPEYKAIRLEDNNQYVVVGDSPDDPGVTIGNNPDKYAIVLDAVTDPENLDGMTLVEINEHLREETGSGLRRVALKAFLEEKVSAGEIVAEGYDGHGRKEKRVYKCVESLHRER